MRFGMIYMLVSAFLAVSAGASAQSPPACLGPCSDCAKKMAGNGGEISAALASVEFDGLNTTFTYRVCQDPASQNLSHWVIKMSPDCCDAIVGVTGGSSSSAACGADPTTMLFGIKFATSGGVPACGLGECAEDGSLFSITLSGNVRSGCTTVAGKIASGESQAYGCIEGPVCRCVSDADCDDGDVCTGSETCGKDGDCQPDAKLADCNANGFDDECDLADGTSTDCDANGVPDECDSVQDCNSNGTQDICDIADGTSFDCNENGVPDECEPEGDCNGNGRQDICDIAEGSSRDCNANGLPDECDIADCDGTPGCDDCNLNGVPDGCDIDSGIWLDVDPVDGILDACVDPLNANGDWTDDIWDLVDQNPAAPYPDNGDGVENLHVTISGFSVFLNDSVEIQTLRLLNGGTLLVTQDTVGDFGTAAAGGILNEGSLLVANDRHISLAGADLTIGPGGFYGLRPGLDTSGCAGSEVCASLAARSVIIVEGDCATFRSGGEMNLDEAMTVSLTGDLVLAGGPTSDCGGGAASRQLGITPSPKFRITGPGSVALDGDFVIDGMAGIENTESAGAADAGRAVASGPIIRGMILGGDFVNHGIGPSLFDWATGTLTMTGENQRFEVAGIDLGPSAEGYLTEKNTLFDNGPHSNFSIGTVVVAAGTHVTFVNEFANTVGSGACDEAFYVQHLIVGAAAKLTLDNVNVYYETFEDGGAVIEAIGCGGLQGLCGAAAPTTNSVITNRVISITTGVPGRQQAVRVIFEDLPPPHDELNGLVMWIGEPFEVSEDSSTLGPKPGFPSFYAAALQCEPFFTDWSTVGTVEVFHEAVVPGGRYPFQVIDESCAAGFEKDFSPPLNVEMARFGDIVGNCFDAPCSAPDGLVGILDVFAVLNKFSGHVGAVSKVRADMEPARLDMLINISDAAFVINAFVGLPYPFPSPGIPCVK